MDMKLFETVRTVRTCSGFRSLVSPSPRFSALFCCCSKGTKKIDSVGEGGGTTAMQRIQSPVSNQPDRLDMPIFSSQFDAQLCPSHSLEGMKRPGILLSHPNHHQPVTLFSDPNTAAIGGCSTSGFSEFELAPGDSAKALGKKRKICTVAQI